MVLIKLGGSKPSNIAHLYLFLTLNKTTSPCSSVTLSQPESC